MDILDNLVALHKTNERLMEISDLKGDLPELLDKQENKLNDMNQNQKEYTGKISDLDKELIASQHSLDDAKNKLEESKDQLFKVSNNKEYEALLLETDHLKQMVLDLSQKLSNMNDEKQSVETLMEDNNTEIHTLSDKIEKNKDALAIQMSDTDKEEQLLVINKKERALKVDKKYLDAYNKLYNKYGQGMANVSRRSCNHCYTQLPPQLLVEIEYNKKVITCPSCSVFLYHENESD